MATFGGSNGNPPTVTKLKASVFQMVQANSGTVNAVPARREWIPLERLTFDVRLQLRDLSGADGKPALFSEQWVQHLEAIHNNEEPFEPLKAVEENRKGKEPVYWVFSGFHRGEVYQRAKVNSVEVALYPGTFRDAQFLALSENRHGLSVKPGDKARAVNLLIDLIIADPKIATQITTKHKSRDLTRAMAATCGVGTSTVGDALKRHSLRVLDGRLAKIKPSQPKPSSPGHSDGDLSGTGQSEPRENDDPEGEQQNCPKRFNPEPPDHRHTWLVTATGQLDVATNAINSLMGALSDLLNHDTIVADSLKYRLRKVGLLDETGDMIGVPQVAIIRYSVGVLAHVRAALADTSAELAQRGGEQQ